jgi:hypothetical protein
MKEGILGPKVEDVSMAVVKDTIEGGETMYYVYLLSFREDIMEGVIINSTGYGEDNITGEKIKTSTLRHTMEILLPNEAAKIEAIMPDVFGLSNEYWISFWVNDTMYDHKFVFLPNTINPNEMQLIPMLGVEGILLNA